MRSSRQVVSDPHQWVLASLENMTAFGTARQCLRQTGSLACSS